MKRKRLKSSEAAILAALVLIAVLFALVPWGELARKHHVSQAKKYDYSGSHRTPAKPRGGKSNWSLTSEYSRDSGTLRLHLTHRYNRPLGHLRLFAEFSSGEPTGPVKGSVLQREDGGTYRTDDVQLGQGDWVMSVTAVERNQLKFRMEQILNVK